MRTEKHVYDMSDREFRAYKRRLRRQREIRRRCMMVFMTFCLVLIGAVSYHAIRSDASNGNDEINFKYYTDITVQYGETLWDIADEYIDYDEYKSKDVYIAEVQRINHLDTDSTLHAGQHLIVPYYSNEFIK